MALFKEKNTENVPQTEIIENHFENALEQFNAACKAVKTKKEAIYEKLNEGLKRNTVGMKNVKLPDTNPFDLEAVEQLVATTGHGIEGKRYAALKQSILSSAFRDEDFYIACEVLLSSSGENIKEEAFLLNKVEAAKAHREKIISEAEGEVKKAETALSEYRKKYYNQCIKPALDADSYLTDKVGANSLSAISFRQVSLGCDATDSIISQIKGLNGIMENARLPRNIDIHAHLRRKAIETSQSV